MTGTDYCKLHDRSPEEAYDALFNAYCDYVHAIIFNRLRSVASREDIEECVSDVFADIFKMKLKNKILMKIYLTI